MRKTKAEFLETALQGKINVIDIGAADKLDACFSDYASIFSFIGFEPEENAYQQLLADNRYQKIYNKALYTDKRDLKFYITRKAQCSSLYYPNNDFLFKFSDAGRWEVISEAVTQTSSLDQVIDSLDVDFIKLDTQGSEIDILKGGENTLKKCFGVRLEVEFQYVYKNQPLFRDVDLYMSQQGFYLYDLPNTKRWSRKEFEDKAYQGTSQLIFSDAVYLRTENFSEYLQQYAEDEKSTKVEKYIAFLISQDYVDLAFSVSQKYENCMRPSLLKEIQTYFNSLSNIHTPSKKQMELPSNNKYKLFIKKLMLDFHR